MPERLQAAMALLERLREFPSLSLSAHQKAGSSGLISHETLGDEALNRFNLQAINKNHGRRSCNLAAWGQDLLEVVRAAEFEAANKDKREGFLSAAQEIIGERLRSITEQEPLTVKVRSRSVEDVIHEVLLQAERKRKTGDVAQYLVGAKLMLRFQRDIPVHAANKGDRKSAFDPDARLGDYHFGNAVIEVAVGPPDAKHLEQIADILAQSDSDAEVWLLTRSDRVNAWQNELRLTDGVEAKRVIVTSVEAFVGQNITELGEFKAKGKAEQLGRLFDLYNERWVAKVGSPGIRIVIK